MSFMPKPTSVVLANDVRYWLDRYALARSISRSKAFNHVFRTFWKGLSAEERAYVETFQEERVFEFDEDEIDVPEDERED